MLVMSVCGYVCERAESGMEERMRTIARDVEHLGGT